MNAWPVPRVTVLLSTYNRLAYLPEAVASIRAQTSRDWELLIVDDASTDGTWAWLSHLDEPNLCVFRQDHNQGQPAAFNRVLAAARGTFVMLMDDDDLLRPQALEHLVPALQTHPHAVAAVGALCWFQAGQKPSRIQHPTRPSERMVWQDLLADWWAVSGQVLYRTAILRQVAGWRNLNWGSDRVLWLDIATLGTVVLVPPDVIDYRVHPGQTKPPNLLEIRDGINADFVGRLDARGQARAERIRVSTHLIRRADAEYAQRHHPAALGMYLQAIRAALFLLRSPLVGPPRIRGVLRSLRRSVLREP